MDWFFSNVQRVTVKDHVCYQWAYVFEQPLRHIEDAGHGSEDINGLCRAYRGGRYGITAAMMEPFANTVLYVMRTPEGKFIPRVDGTLDGKGHGPGGLNGKWMDLCEFAPELFPILYQSNLGRIQSSPQITAIILWHKQHRAQPPKSRSAP